MAREGSELVDIERDDVLTTCLLLIARAHGVITTPDAVLSGLPLASQRLSPALFARASERLGLTSKLAHKPLTELNPALFPAILLLADEKACLIHEVSDGQARISYPELGDAHTVLPLEQLGEIYAGIVIYCRPSFRLDERNVDTRPTKHGHWFWRVIEESRPVYRDVAVSALFINLFAMAMPLFVMNVYDRVVPNHATDTLWVLAIGVFLVLCADLALRITRGWFVDLVAARTDIKLSAVIMERVLGTRMESWPKSAGSFASTVQSFESVRSFIGSMTVTALIDLPFFLLFFVIIGLISWQLALPVLVAAGLIVFYALSVQSRMRQLSDEMSQASAQRNAGLVESLISAETVKSFNASGRIQQTWEGATLFLTGCSARLRALASSVGSGASWVQQVASVAIMLLGVYQVVAGDLTQGGLIAAYLLSSRALAPIAQTASLLTQYHSAATALSSLNEVMAAPQERPIDKEWVSRPVLRGDIEFKNVVFKYPSEEREALSGVSFRIRAGEKIGILGRVGSGKSTLEKLILGLYQPSAGAVFVDGVNLSQIDPAELRRNIGYIPQDVRLMYGSIRDNIMLSGDPLTGEQLLHAVQLSGLGDLVGNHADGLAMQVGEGGGRLSGGQRQAVAVARAVARNSSILLFDEPTSSMDGPMEAHVSAGVARYAVDKTLLLVTHRHSLLSLVDRLIVLDNGKILADGPRQDVLQALSNGRVQKEAATAAASTAASETA